MPATPRRPRRSPGGPNHARIENVEEIADAVERGRGELRGVACESRWLATSPRRSEEQPLLTLEDGLDVVKVLMSAYLSAEQEKTVRFPPRGLESFVPAVARGRWNPDD